jgi:hypothetical protein
MSDLTKLKELGVDDYVKRWLKYVRAGVFRSDRYGQLLLLAGLSAELMSCLQDATELKDKLTGSSRAAIVTIADGLLHQVCSAPVGPSSTAAALRWYLQ